MSFTALNTVLWFSPSTYLTNTLHRGENSVQIQVPSSLSTASYLCPQARARTHIHTHTHTMFLEEMVLTIIQCYTSSFKLCVYNTENNSYNYILQNNMKSFCSFFKGTTELQKKKSQEGVDGSMKWLLESSILRTQGVSGILLDTEERLCQPPSPPPQPEPLTSTLSVFYKRLLW